MPSDNEALVEEIARVIRKAEEEHYLPYNEHEDRAQFVARAILSVPAIAEAVKGRDLPDGYESQFARLGLADRKYRSGVGKHSATNDGHVRALIKNLDEEGDFVAADTIALLVWNLDLWRMKYERNALSPKQADADAPAIASGEEGE